MRCVTSRLGAIGAAVAAMIVCAACSQDQSVKAESKSASPPSAFAVTAVSVTATVHAIDPAKRTVTLIGPEGVARTYTCGKDVINFNQIKVGDQVNATVLESVAVYVRKSGAPPSAGEGAAVALAPKGAKPGVVMSETSELTARITTVDAGKRTMTVQGPMGGSTTVQVAPGVNLSGVKAGDDVVLRCTDSLALLVEPPAAAAVAAGALGAAEAQAIGVDAYIYGYPLVTMEMTRRVMTNVSKVEGTRAPMGQLVRMRDYPTAAFRDVTAPNADTLYTTAWVDLTAGPWVLSLPDAHDRYYLFPMLDAWTTVFQDPGKRTTGTGPQAYAITGPGWKGSLPQGVTEYKSPTNVVWILGRIYCSGTPEDYAAVHKMQDEIALVPLSAYGQKWSPPAGRADARIDMKTPVRDQVNALSAEAYFNLLASLLISNPPAKADSPLIAKMARLGIVPGQAFDISKLAPGAAQSLQGVPRTGFDKIMASYKTAGTRQNGWAFTTQTGTYGTNYLNRALITAIGLGANLPQDAVYPTSETDAEGNPYDGNYNYVMHFDKGQMPPVQGFWSLTMYDTQFFFVDNPLNRYTLSGRNQFTSNPDGSVDLYVQHENPGPDKQSNWLPAPAGRFILMLRLYWPRETPPSIIDGSWKIPAVKKVS